MKATAFLSFTLAALVGLPTVARSHPETGPLPDAVAMTEYRIVLDMNPKDLATRNRLGAVLLRKNRIKDAEREFQEVLRIAPKDFDAHDGMGLVKMKQGKLPESIDWFKKAIALNPQDTMVHHSLGQALEQSGRLQEAEASYRHALEVNERLLRRGVNREKEADRKTHLLEALQNLRGKMRGGKGNP